MTDEILKEMQTLSIEEARLLKAHATCRELGKLDILDLDPIYYKDCIYGQMTGDCYSERATCLMQRCTTNLYDDIKDITEHPILSLFDFNPYDRIVFSPIEALIVHNKEHFPRDNARLIAYLKNETDTLIFENN